MKKLILLLLLLLSFNAVAYEQITSTQCSSSNQIRTIEYDTNAQAMDNHAIDTRYSVSLPMRFTPIRNNPILDIRYTDPVANVYCDRGYLAAAFHIDTRTRDTDIYYGGHMVALEYLYQNDSTPSNTFPKLYPWRDGKGLMAQVHFNEQPAYSGGSGHNPAGAQLTFNLFLKSNSGVSINFVILISNGANADFDEYIGYDPTTNSIHVSTSIRGGQYSTGSIYSSSTFKRASITNQDIKAALSNAGLDIDPSTLYLTYSSVHLEVGDNAGWGEYKVHFRAYGLYLII